MVHLVLMVFGIVAMLQVKRMVWEPQIGNLKSMVGMQWEYKGPGRYISVVFLLYSWGSLFGVPISVP